MDIKIPFLGDGIDSANVIAVLVAVGDTVEKEQTVAELETDKATAPIPSSAAGKVEKIHIKEGDLVSQGKVVLTLSGAGESESDTSAPAAAQTVAPVAVQAAAPVQQTVQAQAPGSYTYQSSTGAEPPASPSIRKMAKSIGLDLTRIPGSGNGGRITLDDVRAHMTMIQSLAFNPPATAASAVAAPIEKPKKPLPDFSKWGPVRTEKLTSLRQKIANNLADAWNTIPHVTQFDLADITDVMALRKKHNPEYIKLDAKLTITVFVMKALVTALKEFPAFNASLDEESGELIYKEYYHIGVAVDTPNGLIVPVIRDVDKKSLRELSSDLAAIAKKARDRKIGLEDLQGATFTLSNLGGFGVGGFTPIVNHPEVAILGMGGGSKDAVFVDGKVVERLRMPVSLSYDHRVIDGADGARFTKTFINALEQYDEKEIKL
ncbi:hypothetical protein HOH87_01415 [bacterium]|jgi:pyruvate dehydrogenase E2 component (dihydrolipoamide acetyltransferase)|nr:hypothetical protein [bacterium]